MKHIDNQSVQQANMDYIKQAMSVPLLEKEQEKELAVAWYENNDEKALHALVTPYMRLVISMANKFKHYGLPLGDLIQEGNIGLMRAAERFEPAQDNRFSTYATWWIRSCIQDYVLRNWSIVRTGSTAAHKSLFFNFRRLRAQIEGKKEREGLNDQDRADIAKKLNVRIKDVEHMEARLSGSDSSLNMSIANHEGDSGTEWIDMLDDNCPTPEDNVITLTDSNTRNILLRKAINTLNEREQHVIAARFLTRKKATLETLGTEIGVSKERVRQIEAEALRKLRTQLGEHINHITDFL